LSVATIHPKPLPDKSERLTSAATIAKIDAVAQAALRCARCAMKSCRPTADRCANFTNPSKRPAKTACDRLRCLDAAVRDAALMMPRRYSTGLRRLVSGCKFGPTRDVSRDSGTASTNGFGDFMGCLCLGCNALYKAVFRWCSRHGRLGGQPQLNFETFVGAAIRGWAMRWSRNSRRSQCAWKIRRRSPCGCGACGCPGGRA